MSFKIALLIDAENISYKDLPHIIKAVRRHGQVVLQAVYGDWEKPNLQKWYEVAKKNDFKIRHQTSASQTKNSTDMKLIMDAMEVLYRTSLEVFCLVTNDADYVPLCDKIHESQKYVIGIGHKHAADAFIRACDQFIFIPQEKTSLQFPVTTSTEVPSNSSKQAPSKKPTQQPKIRKLLSKAFAKAPQDKQGWVGLSPLGMALSQVQTGFNTDDYGYATLSKLLQSMPDFIEIRGEGNAISARLKNNTTAKQRNLNKLQKLIEKAFAKVPQNKDSWMTLSALGTALREIQSGFKSNNYGHATLSKLLKSMPNFVELRGEGSGTLARLKKR